eukprot:8976221-Pyramimonas_sp.AAC.1
MPARSPMRTSRMRICLTGAGGADVLPQRALPLRPSSGLCQPSCAPCDAFRMHDLPLPQVTTRVYSHGGPIRRRECGDILSTDQSGAGRF